MNNTKIYRQILLNREAGKKMLAIFIDLAKFDLRNLASIIAELKIFTPDFIFVGGNMSTHSVDSMIEILKEEINAPIVLMPGDASQFSGKADALIYLSLLSGRNPEYLIGQHIKSANMIKESGIEVIPTSYVLIDGGKLSTIEYLSNTVAIPATNYEIAASTALAGELLGMRMTFLGAGKEAIYPVSSKLISQVKRKTELPIAVGGGIHTQEHVNTALNAGADIIVVDKLFDGQTQKIQDYIDWVKHYNEDNQESSEKMTHPDIL